MPLDQRPQAGIVCEYGPVSSGTTATALRHVARLNAAKAQRLTRVIIGISLGPATGRFSCPADFAGAATVIALFYPAGHAVALWYKTAGCRTLDNGSVLAFQGANASFFDGFEPVLDAVARTS